MYLQAQRDKSKIQKMDFHSKTKFIHNGIKAFAKSHSNFSWNLRCIKGVVSYLNHLLDMKPTRFLVQYLVKKTRFLQ